MKTLTDLPIELLVLICEYVGGAELRRDNGGLTKLTLCRKWYAAARPVFLDSLPGLRLYGHNVGQLLNGPWSKTEKRPLMRKHLPQIRIRLLGHWWDTREAQLQKPVSLEDLANDFDEVDEDPESEDPVEPPIGAEDIAQILRIHEWHNGPLRYALDDLFGDLSKFRALRSLAFEAAGDCVRGDYIWEATICRLVGNLPLTYSLSQLILDINTTGAQSSGYTGQICRDLAIVLPRIEHIRLRLPGICEEVFNVPDTIRAEHIKCKSIMLKLHLPQFDSSRSASVPRPCGSDGEQSIKRTYLHEYMFRAAQRYIGTLGALGKEMERFLISYISLRGPSVITLDCLTMRKKYVGGEFFFYEDDGTPCWFERNEKDMLDGGSYRFKHT